LLFTDAFVVPASGGVRMASANLIDPIGLTGWDNKSFNPWLDNTEKRI
tara:strand:+ start:199 stop:342 length:144 start_codon:yes stop_codon:yes gene_type:complete